MERSERPQWKGSKKCDVCGKTFGLLTRRHHCRLCGRSMCQSCKAPPRPLPRLGYYKPALVCLTCFPPGSIEANVITLQKALETIENLEKKKHHAPA